MVHYTTNKDIRPNCTRRSRAHTHTKLLHIQSNPKMIQCVSSKSWTYHDTFFLKKEIIRHNFWSCKQHDVNMHRCIITIIQVRNKNLFSLLVFYQFGTGLQFYIIGNFLPFVLKRLISRFPHFSFKELDLRKVFIVNILYIAKKCNLNLIVSFILFTSNHDQY